MKPSELVKALKMLAIFEGSEIGASNLLTEAADLIEGLIPRPIKEIDEIDGVGLCIYGDDTIIIYGAMMKGINSERLHFEPLTAIKDDGTDFDGDDYTHFIPLSAIQKLMESGE